MAVDDRIKALRWVEALLVDETGKIVGEARKNTTSIVTEWSAIVDEHSIGRYVDCTSTMRAVEKAIRQRLEKEIEMKKAIEVAKSGTVQKS